MGGRGGLLRADPGPGVVGDSAARRTPPPTTSSPGRHLGWFVVGASIFASNIGSEHLVGLAGSGATDGVAMAHYELHAWCLLVLGWVMVPFYMRSKVFTMPEFLERRFSPAARTLLSMISLVAYVITKIAVGIYAGGIVSATLLAGFECSTGVVTVDSFWIGSVLVVLLTGLYTVLGGMRAVAYTEALQTIILIIGSALVTIFGLKSGGRLGSSCENARRLVRCSISGSRSLPPGGLHWAPIKQSQRVGRGHQPSLVLQQQLPVGRHAVLRPDHRSLVLVHGSVHRPAGAGGEE